MPDAGDGDDDGRVRVGGGSDRSVTMLVTENWKGWGQRGDSGLGGEGGGGKGRGWG